MSYLVFQAESSYDGEVNIEASDPLENLEAVAGYIIEGKTSPGSCVVVKGEVVKYEDVQAIWRPIWEDHRRQAIELDKINSAQRERETYERLKAKYG